jgi:hypothetical protein
MFRKNKRIVLIFLIFGFVAVQSLTAQDVPFKSKLWMEGKVHYGFVIPHHDYMVHLTSQHLTMFELDLVQATNGKKLWEQLHHYPLKGISLLYSDLGGSDYLGKAIAIIPYINFNLTRGNKVNLFFRFGCGVGYLTKRFDRLENYKNTAIGSHFNAAIQMMYEMRWHATNRLEITAGIGLTHFSNGAIKTPNLGINIATLSAGLAYKMDKNIPERIEQNRPELNKKKWEFNVIGIFGISELYAAYGPKYPAIVLSAFFLKPLSLKRKMGIGIDIFYDEANIESLARLNDPVKHKYEVIRPGISCIHKIEFSHLSLIMQLGVYAYTRYKIDGYIFDRLALQYCFGKHYLIHLGLKTHLFTADMIEYGIGYKF